MEFLYNFLFSDGGYSPHGFCIAWNLPVLYTHIFSDLLIAVSYFAIPAIMLVFLRRRKDPDLHAPAMLFVIFITACGVSHLMSILTMYLPYYGLQGMVKLFTGIVSFFTAIALWKMLPDALKIPAPAELMQALADKEREIEERLIVEAKLKDQNRLLDQRFAELESLNEELREFAYAASHDLKSPANTLALWLAEFKNECADTLDVDARDSLDEAATIIERMRMLVEDVLSFSRVANRDKMELDSIDLQSLFATTTGDLRADIKSSGATVEIGDLPTFDGYPRLMSILAQNLLSNAIKFRHPDRPVRISVSGHTTGGRDPNLVLSIKDNGIGISPCHIDKIFGLFKRLHSAEAYSGTGLGLALCRRIAVTHGGTIEVQSDEGSGTEFIISLPLEIDHATQAA